MAAADRSRPKNTSMSAARPNGTARRCCDSATTSSTQIPHISASAGRSLTRSCDPTTTKRKRCSACVRSQPSPICTHRRAAAKQPTDWKTEPLPLGLARLDSRSSAEAAQFDGFASAAGLKGDGETVFLSRLRSMPNVSLLTGVASRRAHRQPGSPQRITGVRLEDGRDLAREACFSPPAHCTRRACSLGIWTQLASPTHCRPPQHVGRNLKLHLLTAVIALSPSRKNDLIRKTTLLTNERFPHSSVQPLGFDGELIGTLVPKLVPRFMAREIGRRAYGFFLQTEDGSHPDNRVLAGDRADAGLRRSSPAAARRASTALVTHVPVCAGQGRHADVHAAGRAWPVPHTPAERSWRARSAAFRRRCAADACTA